MKSNTTPNHGTRCRTSVTMHNATVQQPLTPVFSNSNLTIVMLQAKAGFVNKHNVVPFGCQCRVFIAGLAAQTPMVSGQGRGRGSRVVKVSDRGRHVTSSSSVPLKTHRVGERCTLNMSRSQASSRWCGS
ncbi:hypothetical protein TNCV_2853061 [Trichonephila clavipes]|uniref:Uncharacterized protein n=1 Tax=Trichonephila clavipes TaxID=2585209 RepID=A0A8X6R5X8_TRICX|nr:hypothetical protein TNCV_2853061 [Trichonephila clavipes]